MKKRFSSQRITKKVEVSFVLTFQIIVLVVLFVVLGVLAYRQSSQAMMNNISISGRSSC